MYINNDYYYFINDPYIKDKNKGNFTVIRIIFIILIISIGTFGLIKITSLWYLILFNDKNSLITDYKNVFIRNYNKLNNVTLNDSSIIIGSYGVRIDYNEDLTENNFIESGLFEISNLIKNNNKSPKDVQISFITNSENGGSIRGTII